jgi:hypothetical protein
MKKMKKALKEWNATIEALGQGKQTILIRKYGTINEEFLLYPTVSYTLKNSYISSFKEEHQAFVKEHSFPKKNGDKVEIKYYAKCENIVKMPFNKVKKLKNYYIWTPKHVEYYLKNNNAFVWVLRVYKLKNPFMAESAIGPINFANLKKGPSTRESTPVIDDKNFKKILKHIEHI